MPRRRTQPSNLDEFGLPGGDPADQEKTPDATPVRARRASASTGTRGKIPLRTPRGTIASKAEKTAKVRTDILAYLTMLSGAWSVGDPCGDLMFEQVTYDGIKVQRVEALADAMTAIIARNDAVLDMVAKSGVVADLAKLGALVWPIARAVMKAHGPGGSGHAERAPEDFDAYPAYAG